MSGFDTSNLNWIVPVIGLVFTLGIVFYFHYKDESRDLLSYIPNIWTSLGILGTFFSIVFTLDVNFDEYLIKSENRDGLNDIDIGALVKAIVPAFWTSIIGIGGAIISSIVIKLFYASNDERDDYQSQHIVRLLDKMSENVEHLNAEVVGFSNGLSNSITKRISRAFSAELAAIVAAHSNRMLEIFSKAETSLSQLSLLMETKIDGVGNKIDITIKQEFEELKISLINNKEAIESFYNGLKVDYTRTLSESQEEFTNGFTELSSSAISGMMMLKDELVSLTSRILTQQFEQLLFTVNSHDQRLVQSIQDLKTQLSGATTEEAEGIVGRFADSVNSFSVALEDDINGYIETIKQTVNEIDGKFNLLKNDLSTIIDLTPKDATQSVSSDDDGVWTEDEDSRIFEVVSNG